ncbi:MAG TPA: hypothetical protein VEU09_05085 [Candidatus Binatia bacterium]|nr:hypothetical protein [Candidatus Binatia bacterium]
MDVDKAARDTLDRAVEGIRETGYLEWLTNTYRKATEAAVRDQGAEPRSWGDEDRRAILFEAVAYMGARLLERELGAYFTRRTLLFGRVPDRGRIKAFQTSFLRSMPEKLGPLGIRTVSGVAVTERLLEYSGGWSGKRAYEHFGSCMGRALDPGLQTVAHTVALESVPMLAIVIHGALDRQFGTPPRPKTARNVVSIAIAVAATLALALAGDFSCFVTDSLGDTNPPAASSSRVAPAP